MTITTLASSTRSRAGFGLGFLAFFDASGRLCVYGEARTGGFTQDVTHQSVERYDPSSNTWTELATSVQYVQSQSLWYDSSDRIYEFGGQVMWDGSSSVALGGTDRGQIWDPSTNVWSAIPACPHVVNGYEGRDQQTTFGALTGELWASGGHADTGSQDFPGGSFGGFGSRTFNDVLYYSGGTSGSWSVVGQVTSGAGSSGWNGLDRGPFRQLFSSGSSFYVWDISNGMTQKFDTSANTFSAISSMPFSTHNCAVAADGRLWTTLSGFLNVYDPALNTWTNKARATTAVAGLTNLSTLGYFNNQLVAFGYQVSATTHTNVLIYDIATDTWSVSADSMPVWRNDMTLLADASGLYLINGQDSSGVPSTSLYYWSPGVVAVAPTSFAAVIG